MVSPPEVLSETEYFEGYESGNYLFLLTVCRQFHQWWAEPALNSAAMSRREKRLESLRVF